MWVQKGKHSGRGFALLSMVVAAASAFFSVTVVEAQVCHGTVASNSDVDDLRGNLTKCDELHVVWQGHIVLDSTIEVLSAAVLTVTGRGASAVIDGAGAVQLFSVNGTLSLHNLSLTGGTTAYRGGAVYVNNGTAAMESCTFTNNSAGYDEGGGGGMFVYGSAKLVSCTFTNNSARGGGVVVYNSTATMESCTFTNNSANGGGGVVVYSSNVTMESCAFTNNSADSVGGGVWVFGEGSTATMESCTFTNNSAESGGGGGGVCVYNSTATMESCTFTNNSAESGGGVYVLSSNVTMESCAFTNNSADSYGGGVMVTREGSIRSLFFGLGLSDIDSTATMESCAFTNNSADSDGGGVYVTGDGSAATMESCDFTDNSAGLSGGAVYVDSGSSATMGSCTFTDNMAGAGGGAVFSLGHITDASYCAFISNSAGSSGGAIDAALSTEPLRLQSSTFRGNSAGGDGGAVIGPAAAYVSVNSFQTVIQTPVLRLQNCSFEGNSAAGSGGGAHSKAITADSTTLSKNTAVLGGALWVSSSLSTDSCVFVGNSAVNGGGVYTESLPALNSTTFTSNSADEAGGGLFVLGNGDFVSDCTRSSSDRFSSDSSDSSSTYSSDSSDSSSSSTSSSSSGSSDSSFTPDSGSSKCYTDIFETTAFEDSTAGCCYGPSTSAGLSCADANGQASGLEKCCAAGSWDDGLACRSCPGGFNCSALGLLNTTVSMEAGFWRTDFEDFSIMVAQKCLYPAACKGKGVVATQSSDEYCAEGYMGPYCAVCASGYSSGVAYECNKCAASTKAGVAVAICLALLCVIGAAWYIVSDLLAVGDFTDASSEAKGRLQGVFKLLKRFPFGTLRIPIVVFQILTQYVSITGARFPPLYQNFVAWVNAVNLDMGWVLSVGCLARLDFYDRLLFATCAPLAVFALLGCSYGVAKHRLRCPRPVVGPHRSFGAAASSREDLLEAILHKHVSLAFVVSFLIYSTVSTAVFQTFACDTFSEEEGGASFLRADYSISCDDRKHSYYVIYAAFMIVVYPVGIPAVYALTLWRQRGHFQPGGPAFLSGSAKALAPEGHALHTTGFLWRPYKEPFFWWELVECARRLCLTGFLVFIMPGTSGQAAVACIFSVVSLAAFAHSAPLKARTDAHIYIVGCAIIFLSTFLALMIKVDVSDENAQSQNVISVLLIVLNVCMATAAIVQCTLVARSSVLGASDSSVYGLRRKRRGQPETDEDAASVEKEAPAA